jgi:hypothetical protein
MNEAVRDALSRAEWRKSSYSTHETNCVEVATVDGWVGVRDSKLGEGSPILTYTQAEWAAFVAGIRAGELSG